MRYVLILEAADLDEAAPIASEWPSLEQMPNSSVRLQPAFVRD